MNAERVNIKINLFLFFSCGYFRFFYFFILNNLTISIIISRGSKKVERRKIKRPTKYAILINLEEIVILIYMILIIEYIGLEQDV